MNHRPSILFKIIFFFFLSIVCLVLKVSAQHSIRDSSLSFAMIGATFAYQFPGGDLADRFGNNMNIGAVFQWKYKSNWIIGVEGNLPLLYH